MSAAGSSISSHDPWLPRMTRREVALLAAASVGFALVFTYPLMCEIVYLGPGVSGWIGTGPVWSHLTRLPLNGDWDMFNELRWAIHQTITHFHQFPFWNPYKCGGMPLLGNPEAVVITPFLLVDLIAGPTLGLYIQLVLHLALAFAGGYVLARVIGLGSVAGFALSSVFLSTSWIYLQLSLGNLTLTFPIAYWPWMLALFLIGLERAKIAPLAVGGILLALSATEGNYTFVYAAMMIALVAVSMATLERRIWPLIGALIILGFGAAIGAVKLIPVTGTLALHPRVGWRGPEDDTLAWIPTFLFSRNQDLFRNIKGLFVFACYGAYISPVFAVLAIIGVAAGRLKAIPWVVAAIVFLLIARGDSGPYCALQLLRRLPLCSNIAFPTRFIFPFVFALAPLAAVGAHFLTQRFKPWGSRAVIGLIVLGLGDAWMVGPPNLRYLFHFSVDSIAHNIQFRQFWYSDTQTMTVLNEANLGTIHCWGYGEDLGSSTRVSGFNQTNYRGEYYLAGPGAVNQSKWSPARLDYHIAIPSPTRLIVNQNYFPGWRLADGSGDIADHGGLLAIDLPQSTQDVSLRYRPPHFALAFAISVLGLMATFVLWMKGY